MTPTMPSPAARVDRALRHSRYAQRLLARSPELATTLDFTRPFTPAAMQAALDRAAPADEAALARTLRRLRSDVMLTVLTRDLAADARLEEVTATMSALAEVSIRECVARLHQWMAPQYGEPVGRESGARQDLLVVGMGKLGGHELNVSSDIDLVFLFCEDGDTNGARSISNFEYFTRLARKLIWLLNEPTEDGFVFRVDMRLRPYGESGPLVCSLAMFENYLVTQGREWERYAWIKGRLVCGDHASDLALLVRPFVFRRHLDFGAFASMRELHAQIRQEVQRRDIADNIKLGPGGIREIEFIAQVFQLIRGGREAALRVQPTLAVLEVLAERRLLPAGAVTELREAYVFLRALEHRLQYLDDHQTHRLPAGEADRAIIASAMGQRDWETLSGILERHRADVARHFGEIFATSPGQREDLPAAAPALPVEELEPLTARLEAAGYANAEQVAGRVVAMRTGSRYRQMPASGQARLDKVLPRLVETAASFDNPDATAEGLLDLLDSIGRRESYLALLVEYPQCLEAVGKLASASRWAADYLGQHPILLDELLDTRALYTPPDWPALGAMLAAQLEEHAGDTERQMDTLRHFKHAQTFRLLAQDLAGLLPLETLSDHLSDLACLCLQSVMRLAWRELRVRHRDDPCFAIVGYGKLGGKELGYASDLDIIFLYDDDAESAPEIYARYAMRINTWLTTVTSAGVLYETDLRLRPDGASGLMVSPFAAFEDYQHRKAWVWEHQALTRARPVAGDAAIGARFEALRIGMLRLRRDRAELGREIAGMRARMLEAHPNTSDLFDLKHDRGGIIDVEFIVQYLVLAHAHDHADLTGNIGNLALLKLAGRLGLIEQPMAASVHAAYREYRSLQHALRLRGERYARVERRTAAAQFEAVLALWGSVFAGLDAPGQADVAAPGPAAACAAPPASSSR
jgi:glutamate-ammonia-ligase adenylyltransferase